MHVIARVLAAAYVALAVFAAFVYVQASVNLVNVTEVTLHMDDSAAVTSVEIIWSENVSEAAEVRVFVNVTNPGRVAIEVIALEFVLHMNDTNDPRPWYNEEKRDETDYAYGGFSERRGQGTDVPPGETRSLEGMVSVVPNPLRMPRLAKPDADGRYHPVVWDPWIAYTFVDFDVPSSPRVYFAPFHEQEGVLPSG